MRIIHACLLALIFAACRPPGAADAESDSPKTQPDAAKSAAAPSQKSGDWMWKSSDGKKLTDPLSVKDHALERTPKK